MAYHLRQTCVSGNVYRPSFVGGVVKLALGPGEISSPQTASFFVVTSITQAREWPGWLALTFESGERK